MSISEFHDLSFPYQLELLRQDGIPLLSRQAGKNYHVLFSYHTYYVEAGWNKRGNLQFVRSFGHTTGLDVYLGQLDLAQAGLRVIVR